MYFILSAIEITVVCGGPKKNPEPLHIPNIDQANKELFSVLLGADFKIVQ